MWGDTERWGVICSVVVLGFAVPRFRGGGTDLAGEDALADDFGEEDGGGGGDVEAVGDAEHGDADAEVGIVHEVVGEAVLFAAEAEGDASGEVLLEVEFFGVGGGGHQGEAFGFEPGDGFLRGGDGNGKGEEGAGGGADDVGVVDVGAGVADDDGAGAGGVGTAEHGAEVAGFFDGFADEDEGVFGEVEVAKGAGDLGADGEEAVGALAVGDFLKDGACAGIQFGAERRTAFENVGLVFVFEPEVFAIEEGGGAVGMVEGAADFAVAFGEHEAGIVAVAALAEADDVFDLGIGEACDFCDHRQSIAKRLRRGLR